MSKETMNSLKDLAVLLPEVEGGVTTDGELIHQEPKFKEHDKPTHTIDNEGKSIDLSIEELKDHTPPSPWKEKVTDPKPKSKPKGKAPHRIPTDEMARSNFETLDRTLKPIFDYMANKILKETQANAKEAALFGSHVNIIDMVNEVIRPEGQARQHWRYLLLNAFGVLPMQFNLDHLTVYTRDQLAHAIKRVNGLGEFPAGTLKGMRYRHSRVDVLLDGDPNSMLRLLGKAMFSVI